MNIAKNIGSADKIARLVVGALLIVLTLTGTIGLWGWIGVVPIATALMNWCPAYTLLGIKTCPTDNSATPSN
jgi:O-antigen ligase